MTGKRVTIYHIAEDLGMSASYVSRALNDHPSVSEKIKEKVKKRASELNYKHNTHAANLRQGSSKTIGLIVPHINQSFFSEVISGIEEVCFDNKHNLIICQTHESFQQECRAIETLIRQNVDCILICISAETKTLDHLKTVQDNNIIFIQFDRYIDNVDSYKVINDNEIASYNIVKHLVKEGYKKIAFIGGPTHLATYKHRKDGFIKGIKEAKLVIPYNYIVENALTKEAAMEVATELLTLKDPPDAFITVSDYQSVGILQVAESFGIAVPQQLGIFGFANESFTDMVRPTLSSVDQRSKYLGQQTAILYFSSILKEIELKGNDKKVIIKTQLIIRQSSQKKSLQSQVNKRKRLALKK